jgi:hypothetical protein
VASREVSKDLERSRPDMFQCIIPALASETKENYEDSRSGEQVT